jgi:hypothetical protein
MSPEKELVMEGFPRSANTFAVVAFRQAQERDVPMAHHLHIEAQILEGVRLGKPVIVLIRKPADAVKSLIIRHPSTDVESAFKRYISFYKNVEKVIDKVVLADFDVVTSDLGAAILELNQKYKTNFKVFESTPENIEQVYSEVGAINRLFDEGKETHVARPSGKRERMRVTIPQSRIFWEAEAVYEQLLEKGSWKG